MPARRRATTAPTSPRAPIDGMDPSDAPDRLGAPSPAPLPEEQSPETCDAQFELLAENVSDLRDAVAALIARKSETATQREDAVERCVEILGRVRATQRRALWGLEHLNAQTRRRDVETDRARVAAATAAYERAHHARNLRDHEHAQGEGADDALERSGGIALVDLKEYRVDAKRRGLTTTTKDEGDTMLRRLEHELILRKEMCEEKKALERELEELRRDVETRRKVLGKNLESQLANLRRAAEPFRRAFDVPYVETEAVETRVRLLPTPLYVAYAQLKHAQQNGEDARVEILGSTDDAEAFARRPTGEEGEIATDDGEETDNRRHNKRARRDGGRGGGRGGGRAFSGLYEEHPLRVELRVGDVRVFFAYLVKLNVIVANSSGGERDDGEKGGDAFLDGLFENDAGEETPNHANFAVAPPDFSFDASSVRYNAKPYAWAQNLAGMKFLPPMPPALGDSVEIPNASEIARKTRATDVIRAIRDRAGASSA